jgi:hypothetical protein
LHSAIELDRSLEKASPESELARDVEYWHLVDAVESAHCTAVSGRQSAEVETIQSHNQAALPSEGLYGPERQPGLDPA